MTKVAMEAVDPVRRRLAVEISAGLVAEEIERAYDQLRRRANVPGFRQGRAPRSVLERIYGTQVRADVHERLVRESYVEALRDQQLDPVGMPEIITESTEPGEPLRYSATVEVRPEIELGRYEGLTVERPRRPVADADVDRAIDQMRQSRARLEPVEDRAEAQAGDVAVVDYEARDANANARVGQGQGRLIEVGGEPDQPGAHLVGARVGAPVAFEITYAADHSNAELAGKQVAFTVTITALRTRLVPPLDDAFATDAGCAGVDDLRTQVRLELEGAEQREAEAAVRSAVVSQLVQAHTFDVPDSMVERRVETLIEDVLDGLGNRRPPASREPALRERLRGELREQARAQVRASLLLEAIAAREQLEIDDDALDARIDRLAESAGKARERVRALYQDAGARAGLRARLLQERAVELVAARAAITDVDATSAVAGASGNG